MTDIATLLAWKYPGMADTTAGAITGWRHPTIPQPDATAMAQIQADYTAQEAPKVTARAHAAAVALDVEGRVLATGHTMSELFVRLHYTAIKRIAAGSRTALETAFINAVDAADAETP